MQKTIVFTGLVAASLLWNSHAGAAGYAVALPAEQVSAQLSALRDQGAAGVHDSHPNRVSGAVQANKQANEPERLILAAASGDPRVRAEAEERTLRLTRNERLTLQRELTLLGFSTGGVDGVFGPKTRAAIRRFQASRNYAQTGYLTAQQVRQIHREAEQHRVKPVPVLPVPVPVPVVPKPVQPQPVQPQPVQPQPVQPQPVQPQPVQPQPTQPQPVQPQPDQPQPGQPQPGQPKPKPVQP
ncbi:peptidoglycan-binding domain-containing protein [Thalassovita mangrovi]|uniref:Peptidoglycan binding-like domain-containing protein n=1 Tax=Thalassovita mangrovi TaxID=2692236 RepID=A0A6L8LR78_9RHOB|nr:peptidoglycan-binding domain-containing protein [Thalassovita mangrovi]MYM55679.1 hypothetical protein [Thalassovita mangrovi]